jgi:hypothetical protein
VCDNQLVHCSHQRFTLKTKTIMDAQSVTSTLSSKITAQATRSSIGHEKVHGRNHAITPPSNATKATSRATNNHDTTVIATASDKAMPGSPTPKPMAIPHDIPKQFQDNAPVAMVTAHTIESAGIIVIEDDSAVHRPTESQVPPPVKHHYEHEFDADMHAFARARLLHLCPLTAASIEYTEATNEIADLYADIDWVRGFQRDLDDKQFSLANSSTYMRARRQGVQDPEIVRVDKKASQTRHRLMTRERQNKSKIQKLQRLLNTIEHEFLEDWESLKHR